MPPETVISLMTAFEHSALGQAARGTSWLYPVANLIHVLGAALLVGAIVAFDIHVMRRGAEIRAVSGATLPIAAAGLLLQVVSGLVLLSAEASALVGNPAFQFKMGVLIVGVANIALFHHHFGDRLQKGAILGWGRALAVLSLVCWGLVLLAGRAIAYL